MIHIYVAPRSRTRTQIEAVVPAYLWGKAVTLHQTDWQHRPRAASMVVTTSKLTSAIQRFAARLGTAVVVTLPEGYEWLQNKIEDAARHNDPLSIVDAVLDKADPLAMAKR